MTEVESCTEPEVGARIEEYNADALVPPEKQKLTLDEDLVIAKHIMRCGFCRKRVSEEGRWHFQTLAVLMGLFIDDPVRRKKRQQIAKLYLGGKLRAKYPAKKLFEDVPQEELLEMKVFWGDWKFPH